MGAGFHGGGSSHSAASHSHTSSGSVGSGNHSHNTNSHEGNSNRGHGSNNHSGGNHGGWSDPNAAGAATAQGSTWNSAGQHTGIDRGAQHDAQHATQQLANAAVNDPAHPNTTYIDDMGITRFGTERFSDLPDITGIANADAMAGYALAMNPNAFQDAQNYTFGRDALAMASSPFGLGAVTGTVYDYMNQPATYGDQLARELTQGAIDNYAGVKGLGAVGAVMGVAGQLAPYSSAALKVAQTLSPIAPAMPMANLAMNQLAIQNAFGDIPGSGITNEGEARSVGDHGGGGGSMLARNTGGMIQSQDVPMAAPRGEPEFAPAAVATPFGYGENLATPMQVANLAPAATQGGGNWFTETANTATGTPSGYYAGNNLFTNEDEDRFYNEIANRKNYLGG